MNNKELLQLIDESTPDGQYISFDAGSVTIDGTWDLELLPKVVRLINLHIVLKALDETDVWRENLKTWTLDRAKKTYGKPIKAYGKWYGIGPSGSNCGEF